MRKFRMPKRFRRKRKVCSLNFVNREMASRGLEPTVFQYGGYDGNYGSHAMSFSFMGCTFWFSYETLIAFQIGYNEQVALKNYWGPTTGKHLRHAGADYENRLDAEEFAVVLNNQLKKHGLNPDIPFLRVDQDPKTLDKTGNIGIKQRTEEALPIPKPKKSDFYLYPKKPTRAQKRWVKQQERRAKLREELRTAGQDMTLDVAFV